MKKTIGLLVVVVLVMAMMLSGCATPAQTETSPAASTPAASSSAVASTPAASSSAAESSAVASSASAEWVNAYDGKTGLEPQPTKKDKKIIIGYTPSAMNTHHQIVIYGAQEQIKNLGLNAELLVQAPTGQSAVAEQVSIVEAWIEQGVDVLCVAPCAGSDEALLAAYEKAAKAGIPVFEFNTPALGSVSPQLVANVGYEQTKASGMMAQWVADQANGKDINVAIVKGMPGIHQSERSKGFAEVAAKYPNIKIVDEQTADNWSVENAIKVAETMLKAHPEIEVMWAQYDEMALGVYTVVKSLGMENKVKVIGYENIPGANDSIKNNELWATVDNGPKQMGRNLITAVNDYVMLGKPVDKIINFESIVFDRNNIGEFDTKEYFETK